MDSSAVNKVFLIAAGIVAVALVTAVLDPGGRGPRGTVDFIRGGGDFFVRLIGSGPGGWAQR